MKFIGSVQKIKEEVDKASLFCVAKNSLSITSCVLISASEDTVSISATDGKMEYYSTFPASVEADGETLVFVDKLGAILKNLPLGDATFTLKDSTLSITMDSAPGLKVNMKTIPSERFTPIAIKEPSENLISIDSKIFSDMVDHVMFATDQNRINLSGVYLRSSDGNLDIVATDGKAIALAMATGEYPDINVPSSMPLKFVSAVKVCCTGKIFISFTDQYVVARTETCYIYSPMVGSNFPPYRRVTDVSHTRHASLETTELYNAINLVNVMADDKNKKIFFTLDNNGLRIDSANDNYGNTIQTVNCQYEGEPIKAIFNYNVLTPCIKAIPHRKVTVSFTDDRTAWKFATEDGAFVYVAMPMNK